MAKKWKQPHSPLMGKWRNKMQCIHTMEYQTTIKRESGLMLYYHVDGPQKYTNQTVKGRSLVLGGHKVFKYYHGLWSSQIQLCLTKPYSLVFNCCCL